jgi:putative nucleotidyltransferase with HDIG domain
VCFVGLFIFGSVAWQTDISEHVPAMVLLTVASFLTQVYELEIYPKGYISTQMTIAATAIFIGGAAVAIWVIVISTLVAEAILRWDHLQVSLIRFLRPVCFNTAQLVVSAGSAIAAYQAVADAFPAVGHAYYSMAAAFVVYYTVNNLLVATVVVLTTDEKFTRAVRAGMKNFFMQLLTMGSLAIMMTRLYEISASYLVLGFVPLALVHYSAYGYIRLRKDSHLAFRQITDLLSERDQYTGDHSEDVEQLAVELAEATRLSDDEVDAVRSGAAIHDIGKLAIPDAILNKLGPLNELEFERMKQHTIIGAQIIQHLDIYRHVVPIVRHEHEHWDGSGYPDGLSGTEIPIGARIVAVADVYSALTTERGYRVSQGKPIAYSHEDACSILQEMSGSILDPDLVDLFIRTVALRVDDVRGKAATADKSATEEEIDSTLGDSTRPVDRVGTRRDV